MKISVIKNAKRNIIYGFINKIAVMLCPFVTKTVLRYTLGAKYLGLSSLFASIITVLSLSELGFSSAITYFLYKPIAENDHKQVSSLLSFYKKAYQIIGLVVLGIGLTIVPFLRYLIKDGDNQIVNIYVLYLIYLSNTVISYFLYSYLTVLISALQRDDINSKRNTIIQLAHSLCQIIVLLLTKSYYLYALLLPLTTIINNLWIAYVVKKEFPQYMIGSTTPITYKNEIKRLVEGSFIQKACNVTRNSLDSICVSTFLGLTLTAIYSNYYYIISSITALMLIICLSFTGGIGNRVAFQNKESNYVDLKRLDFVYLLLSGWASIFILCLTQPFMEIWMGKEMLLDNKSLLLFVVYFYSLKLGDMRSQYNSTNGLWWEHRWRAIFETVANLVLNIILGKFYGIPGIIVATMISLLLFNYIWGVRITFHFCFDDSYKRNYYLYQFKYTIVNIIVGCVTCFICQNVAFSLTLYTLIIRFIICLIVPLILFYFIYHKSEEFCYAKNKILNR